MGDIKYKISFLKYISCLLLLSLHKCQSNENSTQDIFLQKNGSLLEKLGSDSLPEYRTFNDSNDAAFSKNLTGVESSIRGSRTTGYEKPAENSATSKISTKLNHSERREISSSDWDESDSAESTMNFTGLNNLFDIYDPNRLALKWNSTRDSVNVSSVCVEEMGIFLSELRKGTKWALKMEDATGSYSAGFFWGNNYWTGSENLCKHVEYIPFKTGFFTAKLRLNLPRRINESTREIYLGLCLPFSCNEDDVNGIVDLSVTYPWTEDDRLQIINIRSPHLRYDLLKDSTFWILVGVSSVAFLLILTGTTYDLYLNPIGSDSSTTTDRVDAIKQIKSGPLDAEMTPPNNNNNIINNAILECNSNHLCTVDENPAIERQIQKPPEKNNTNLGLISQMLLAFSVRLNMNIICSKNTGDNTIPVLHGLRVVSMCWVILGHVCLVTLKYSDNLDFRKVAEKELLYETINKAPFSVDTFFFLSGCLVSFLYFRTVSSLNMEKLTMSTGILSRVIEFIGILGYRFLRLTVPYMFFLGVVEVVMKLLNANSVFEPPTNDHETCSKYWWRNALYINTLFPNEEMCMLWSWYLANDTQFFILGSILLILAVRHFILAGLITFVFLLSSWLTTAFLAHMNEHKPQSDDPLALFDEIYDKPWTRLGPYLIGMVTGWILYKTDCKIKMHKVIVFLGWCIAAAVILLLIYGLHDAQIDNITAAAYSSLSHSVWALGLSWLVIACTTGHGWYIERLLALPILHPFSRVTYCAYLVHPLMIRVVSLTTDSPQHLSVGLVMIHSFGQIMVSYILAFILSLSFEAPVVSLLKVMTVEVKRRIR